MAERRMRAGLMPGTQVGRTPSTVKDQQLMADQRGFGNHGTKSSRPCQSDDGDNHMNEQDPSACLYPRTPAAIE
jgi:hypothetical protein